MIKRYALIRDNVVFNFIAWDGQTGNLPNDSVAVEIPDELFVNIGFTYDPETGEFTDPNPPAPEPPPEEP